MDETKQTVDTPENEPKPENGTETFALDVDVHEEPPAEKPEQPEAAYPTEHTVDFPVEPTRSVPVVNTFIPAETKKAKKQTKTPPTPAVREQRRKRAVNHTVQTAKVSGKVALKILSYAANILLTILLVGIITGSIVALVFALYVKSAIDPTLDVDLLTSGQSQTTTLYYYDDNNVAVEMEDQRLYGAENRLWVSYEQIPDQLINAFIAIEDKRFITHGGVDWITTAKAVLHFATGSGSAGGSTITQQLIKNLTGEDEVRIQRKVQEIFRAMNLEKQYSKNQIMEMYLNTIYLSQGTYGVEAASFKYFNKDVKDLTLEECAALASIVKYPTKFDPIQNPENNKDRRKVVLTEMKKGGSISQAEYDEAYNKDLTLNVQETGTTDSATTNSWYTDAVIEDVLDDLQEQYGISRVVASRMIYAEGLSIYTCMDKDLQTSLEQIYLNDANFPQVNSVEQLQSAAVIIDQKTGEVVALVGGRGEKTQSRVFNLATQAERQPGSAIKPIVVYGPALDAGLITFGSVFDDAPLSFNADGSPYPSNLPYVYNGLTYVDDAIARSVNTVAMRVMLKLGAQEAYEFGKYKAGLNDLTDRYEKKDGTVLTDVGPALALGGVTVGVTVEQMAGAYTMYANDGIYNAPRTYSKVLDKDGNVLLDNPASGEVAVSAETASIMTKMLQDVAINGTCRTITLQNSVNVAVKSGTTSSDFDRYCVGYTPYYTCAVWTGYETPKAINTSGVSPSTAMWDTVMTAAHQKILANVNSGAEQLKSFELASGVVTATFCADSGKLMTDACKVDARGNRAVTGYFTATTVPSDSCDVHVLVDFDTDTWSVASKWCPHTKKVGLLNYKRSLTKQVTITDAQFMYWADWSPKKGVVNSTSLPCFAAMIPAGTYVGESNTSRRAINSFCYEHFQGHEDDPEKTATTATTKVTETTESTEPKETAATTKTP